MTAISYITATSGGDVSADGGSPIVSKGVCWNTSSEPTIENSKTTEKAGLGVFSSNLIGLVPNTLYYLKAYATNIAGTAYGNQVSFTTNQLILPTVIGPELTIKTTKGATFNCNITSDGGSNVTERGICWSKTQNPTTADSKTNDGSGIGSFTSTISGLTSNTTYYARMYSINSIGTAYSPQVSFTTNQILIPTLTTNTITSITPNSASGGGSISNDGGDDIIARGICWNTVPNPTTSDSKTNDSLGEGTYISNITGLIASTTYYVKAYAINSAGTAYGNQVSFTTIPEGTIADVDGNIYHTITIGTQVWLRENLQVTHYRNGDAIIKIADNNAWPLASSGAYCNYGNDDDINNINKGGRLYNWFAANDSRKIAPVGWHVPTDTEWTILTDFLGGLSVAGGKLIDLGFNLYPGGSRSGIDGQYYNRGAWSLWWSATKIPSQGILYRWMVTGPGIARDFEGEMRGYSVRCLKD